MLDPYPCYDYVSNCNIIWCMYIYIYIYTVYICIGQCHFDQKHSDQVGTLSFCQSLDRTRAWETTMCRIEPPSINQNIHPIQATLCYKIWVEWSTCLHHCISQMQDPHESNSLPFYHLPHIGHTGYMCCHPPIQRSCPAPGFQGAFHCIIDRLCGPNIRQSVAGWGLKVPQQLFLVGGWTNPSEKYESKWESLPGRGENEKCLKPPTSFIWSSDVIVTWRHGAVRFEKLLNPVENSPKVIGGFVSLHAPILHQEMTSPTSPSPQLFNDKALASLLGNHPTSGLWFVPVEPHEAVAEVSRIGNI